MTHNILDYTFVSNKILLKGLDSKYTQNFITKISRGYTSKQILLLAVYICMFIHSSEQKSSIICSIYQAYNKLRKVKPKNISNAVNK